MSDATKDMMIGDLTLGHLARLWSSVGTIPVKVVAGDEAPRRVGMAWHYTTPGGKFIHHPGAYHWPKVYHASTQHVRVGAGWGRKQARRGWREDVRDGVRCYVQCGSRVAIHGWTVELAVWTGGGRTWLVEGPQGRSFHCSALGKTAREAVRAALLALTRQRKADRAWAAGLGRPLSRIAVTAEHARRAGACQAGILSWCERAGLDPDATVQADDLLTAAREIGEVEHVRRAVAVAARDCATGVEGSAR